MTNAERTALIKAVKTVVKDQRLDAWEPEWTDRDVVNYVRNALWVRVEGQPLLSPNWEVTPDSDYAGNYEAYKAVLLATDEELDEVFLTAWR